MGNKSQTFGTLGNVAEPGGATTSRRCMLAQGTGRRAGGCSSPRSHQLAAGGRGQQESLGLTPHSPRRRDGQGNSGRKETQQERLWEPEPCCTSLLLLLAQPAGDMSHCHLLASGWAELKLKTTIFFPYVGNFSFNELSPKLMNS